MTGATVAMSALSTQWGFDMNVKQRQQMEEKIIRKFFESAIKAGYTVAIHDGEEKHGPMQDVENLMAASFSVDMEHFMVYNGNEFLGEVLAVYGNDGWDVIADYSMNIESLLDNAMSLADELEVEHG